MEGVKETKEVLVAGFAIAKAMAAAAKDGIQITDVIALVGNEQVKAALAAAAEGITKVPAEMGDLTLAEGIELGTAALAEIPALLEALKK